MNHILTTVNVLILPGAILALRDSQSELAEIRQRVTQALLTQRVGGLNPQSILCCRWDKNSNAKRLCGFYACCVITPKKNMYDTVVHIVCY